MSHPGKQGQALPALCQHAGRVSKTNVSTQTLTDVTPDMTFFRNEIFGAVAAVLRLSTEAEALEYGIVGINEGMISNEMAPFGGVKESGSGREGSKYGIEDYVEVKYMLMGGLG